VLRFFARLDRLKLEFCRIPHVQRTAESGLLSDRSIFLLGLNDPDLMCAQSHRGHRWCVKSVARHPTGSVSERALRRVIGPTTSLSFSDSAA
jgi:hypothetical protein